jgi:hypothetical protein
VKKLFRAFGPEADVEIRGVSRGTDHNRFRLNGTNVDRQLRQRRDRETPRMPSVEVNFARFHRAQPHADVMAQAQVFELKVHSGTGDGMQGEEDCETQK